MNKLYSLLCCLFFVSKAEYITPVGDNTCEGFVREEDATYIVPEKVKVKEKYFELCFSPTELFQCTKYREQWETDLKKVKGPLTKAAIVCCEGYKQIEDRCVFDKEKQADNIMSTIVIICLGLSALLLVLGFIVPTFMYLREKRRRIHLEDLEHDPDVFTQSHLRQNQPNWQGNNIYISAQLEELPEDSMYETIDENRGQPPAYEPCERGERQAPPPYAAQISFNEHCYDQLRFDNMKGSDLSYGDKVSCAQSSSAKPVAKNGGYSKVHQSYNSLHVKDAPANSKN